MTDTDKDPMLFGDAEEQAAYRANVIDIMKHAVEEDRAARRSAKPTDESPAVLVGSAGMAGGLNRAL